MKAQVNKPSESEEEFSYLGLGHALLAASSNRDRHLPSPASTDSPDPPDPPSPATDVNARASFIL
jgi:hypothetical protein